jgi:hypothetical protein
MFLTKFADKNNKGTSDASGGNNKPSMSGLILAVYLNFSIL